MSARQQREEISHRDALPPRHQSVVAEPVRPTLKGLVPGISRVPTQIKTIVPKSGSTHHRIDTQVPVRRAGTVYADIQCQIRDDSVAAVIWPVDALDRDAVLEWLPEEGRGGGVYDDAPAQGVALRGVEEAARGRT